MQSTVKFFERNSLSISVFIVSAAFAFSRLPFFLYTPIIGVSTDTFDYFFCVEQLLNGKIPAFDVIPPGFSLFVAIVGLFSEKIITVIVLQNLLALFCSLILVYAVYTFIRDKIWSIPVAIVVSVFIMDAESINRDTSLLTDSLYCSSLMLVSALLLLIIKIRHWFVWILFPVSLMFSALIRSNGLYIYFLVIAIILFMLVNKYSLRYYILLLIPFLVINISWAFYNWKNYDVFFIGNTTRLLNMFSGDSHDLAYQVLKDEKYNNNYEKNKAGIIDADSLFFLYSSNVSIKKPPFYYTGISVRYFQNVGYYKYRNGKYSDYYKSDQFKYNLQEYAMFNSHYEIPLSLRKLVLKEYYDENEYQYTATRFEKHEDTMYMFFNPYLNSVTAGMSIKEIYNRSYNFWFFLTYLFHLFYEIILWNVFWVILFYVSLILSFVLFIRSRFKDENTFVIHCICQIHFLSMIIVSNLNYTFQPRYVEVSEFIMYIIPIIFLAHLLQKKKIKSFIEK